MNIHTSYELLRKLVTTNRFSPNQFQSSYSMEYPRIKNFTSETLDLFIFEEKCKTLTKDFKPTQSN